MSLTIFLLLKNVNSLTFLFNYQKYFVSASYLFLPFAEFVWRCILRKQLEKLLAALLGVMSAAILLAEATLLPRGVDLSLFSILIKSVGKQEVLVQVGFQISSIDDTVMLSIL